MIRIVIADDHQMFLDGIRFILDSERDIAIVDEAKDGLELIKSVEKHRPDIVLTDIRMPGMDGVAAVKYLTEKFPQTPILALSMFDQEEDIIEMLKAGAAGYILKKADRRELVKAIHTLLKNRPYYSPSIAATVKEKLKDLDHYEPASPLTKREREILRLLADGKTSRQIADALNLSKYTVDTHRKNIHKKLDIKSNAGLVKYALKHLSDS